MDRKAHVESSSSQNVNQKVFGHIERGAGGRGFRAVSTEGSSFFIPRVVLERYGLAVGQGLAEEEYLRLEAESQLIEVKQKAVDLLARRDHSAQELRQKLSSRSFSPGVIEAVIEQLLGRGYLDDHRFALSFIRQRLSRKPESIPMLTALLQNKGVNQEIISQALEESDIDTRDLARRAVNRYRKRGDSDKRLIQRLCAKGFSYGEIKRALEGQQKE